MINKKSARKSLKNFKKIAVRAYDKVSDNGKMSGAALLGVGVGVASTLLTPMIKNLVVTQPSKSSQPPA